MANDIADNLVNAIKFSYEEVSPSTIFAAASIFTEAPFIKMYLRNISVPGWIEGAEREGLSSMSVMRWLQFVGSLAITAQENIEVERRRGRGQV